VLNAGAGQTLSLVFTPDDTTTYNSVAATVTINVLKITPTVTWPTLSDIVYGTPLDTDQQTAKASVPGSFSYSIAAGTVLPAGSGQTLSVTFTPTDAVNYSSVTLTNTLNVLKATPLVTWPNPAAITYGTPLSAAQLNAFASVPGTFRYSAAAGTVLHA